MHESVQKSISLPKASSDLGDGLEKFIAAVHGALADGWQIGADLPVIVTAAISDLATPMAELQQLGVESHEDILGVAQALANSGFAIAKSLKKA